MKYIFCSLWDSAYMLKGLTLINSLIATCEDNFRLYVMAIDAAVYKELPRIEQVVQLSLTDIEDEELAKIRKQRTWQEYIWTLTPTLMNAVFELYEPGHLAYIDADTFFFQPPEELYKEVGGASIAAIPHRFEPGSDAETRCLPNGMYNVNWVYAKNDRDGRNFVRHWDLLCKEWCFYKNEHGKFADQGYLNFLLPEYCGHTVKHLGSNLAPWNQMQYSYRVDKNGLYISDGNREDPLIFYHTHELLHDENGNITRKTNWPLHPIIDEYIYEIYADWLKRAAESKVG